MVAAVESWRKYSATFAECDVGGGKLPFFIGNGPEWRVSRSWTVSTVFLRRAKYGFPLLWCVRLPCSRVCAWFPSCYMLRFDLADRDKLVRRGDRRHFACHFDIDRFSHGRSRSKLLARLHRSRPSPVVSSEFLPFTRPPKPIGPKLNQGTSHFFRE